MTAQDLKNSILQLAVQGKLVPQDPSDEPASELLKRICAEKTIKRQKKATEIIVEDIPFDIPDAWEWIKFGDLGELKNGYAFKSAEYKSSGVQVVRISDLGDGNIESKNAVYYEESIDLQQYLIPTNAFLICMTGSIGKMAWVRDSQSRYLNQRVGLFCPHSVLNHSYLWLFLHSPYVINRWVAGKTSLNGNIKNSDITDLPCPIPPLSEQERIVAKIEELMPLVEEYGEAEKRLSELNAEFPDKLRKSILQQAVQGKLTERDSNDEPASELLKRIRAERAVLQKNKAAKKSQANETIAVDEIPFDIPDTWEWVNLGWICQKVGAGSTPKGGSAVYVSEGIKFLREQNVHDDGLYLDGVVYIDEKTHSAKAGSQVQPQDILMNITGGSIGRNALVPDDFDTANVNQHVLIIRLVDKELRHYLHYCFSSPAVLNQMFTKQAGDKPGLSATKVENFLIPIPPIAEQKRIVARVEELLAVCDGLK